MILRNQLHGGKQVDKDVYELPAQRPSSNSLFSEDSAVVKHILLTLEYPTIHLSLVLKDNVDNHWTGSLTTFALKSRLWR